MKKGKREMRSGAAVLERQVAERERRGVGVSTPERVRQAGDDALDIHAGVQRISQAIIDRLLARGSITPRQHEAGDRFRTDAYESGMVPSGALAFEAGDRIFGSRTPQFMAASRSDAYRRWTQAQGALGPRLLPIVDEVCWASGPKDTLKTIGARLLGLTEKRAEVAALAVLRVGLDTLADHYGI